MIRYVFGWAAVVSLFWGCSATEERPSESLDVERQELWASRWENLGGDAVGDPAVASWSSGRLDVFWRGSNNHLMHRWSPYNGGWSFLEDLGGTVMSSPAAVSTDVMRLDVFYFNNAGDLEGRIFDGSAWSPIVIGIPAAHKAPAGSGPTITSWSPGRLDVFWRGAADNHLKHIWRTSYVAAWTSVEDLGETLASDPGAVSSANLKIDVFWRDSNSALRHKWFPSCVGCNTWAASTTRTASNKVTSAPDVASWGTNRLDVFWRKSGGGLDHTWRFDDGTWFGAVEHLGGVHGGGPAAVSWDTNRIDIFMRDDAAGDIEHTLWQTASQTTPLHTQPPPQPTVVATNNTVTGSPDNIWEYSSVAAPPTAACPGGAVMVSGTRNGGADFRRIAPATGTATGVDVTAQLGFGNDVSIENDSVMTRAKNGDLMLIRGATLNASCGDVNGVACTKPAACPNHSSSATAIYRSTDCGATWTIDAAKNVIDPKQYLAGKFGGGACWAGWDREEVTYDYFTDRLFVTFGAEPTNGSGAREMYLFGSQVGGNGPFETLKLADGVSQPLAMTSLPGRLLIFGCEGGAPKLRWIDAATSLSGTMRSANIAGQTCTENPDFIGQSGSVSIARVTTYTDDLGVQWWVVRVSFPRGNQTRIMTVRVNAAGTLETLDTHDIVAGAAPSGQTQKGAVQLTAIEPYAMFDSSGAWTGENTTVYYWREQFWSSSTELLCNRTNQQNLTRALAVRDIAAYGQPFQVGSTASGTVCPKLGASNGKPGDYVKGAFWFDSGAPEAPLRYFLLRPDMPADVSAFSGGLPLPRLRGTVLSLPRGMANN
jgi:hypothetical protein